jgi:hypothetical protein
MEIQLSLTAAFQAHTDAPMTFTLPSPPAIVKN